MNRHRMLRFAWALCALMLLAPGGASAGWQTFDRSSGLPGNQTSGVFQDPAGDLWVTTSNGTSRFNGVAWSNFPYLQVVAADADGHLYGFIRGERLCRFDGAVWDTLAVQPPQSALRLRSACVDRRGRLWLATDNGTVASFDGTSWKRHQVPGNYLHSITEDRSGSIWVGSGGWGAFRYDGTSWTQYRAYSSGIAGDHVTAIAADSAGNVWFGTWDRGLSRFDGSTWRTFTMADGLADSNVVALRVVRDGSLWVGSYGSGGVSHFDGENWRIYTTAHGLADNAVSSIFEDRDRNLWFCVSQHGVCRYDRVAWTNYTPADGLPPRNYCFGLAEDLSGNIWMSTDEGAVARFEDASWRTLGYPDDLPATTVHVLGTGRSGNVWARFWGLDSMGIARFDGTRWITYRVEDDPGTDRAFCEDRNGAVWLGSGAGGALRFDGNSWQRFTTSDGLGGDFVSSIVEDRDGTLWFGTDQGVSRFDGTAWRSYTTADGMASPQNTALCADRSGGVWAGGPDGLSYFDGSAWRIVTDIPTAGVHVWTIYEDREGRIWFGSPEGASSFDGTSWRTYTQADGLPTNNVITFLASRRGDLWMGTSLWVTRHEPDRVPPRSVFAVTPVSPSASRDHLVTFAAFAEARSIQFSTRLDGRPWSEWSSNAFWTATGLPDGRHVLEVRSRDYAGNVEPVPAATVIEVDGTPPIPSIASPGFGAAVRRETAVFGTTTDARFERHRLGYRVSGAAPGAPYALIAESTTPVSEGTLGTWDVSQLPDGDYDLQLTVTDTLGLVGTDVVTVVVDNQAPYVGETVPVKISAASGGDAFTTGAESHLYFAPHAFAEDAVVTIEPNAVDAVPAALPGATRVLPGFTLHWAAPLLKPARFELSVADAAATPGTLALHHSSDGTNWQRLGGTLAPGGGLITLAVTHPGRYALYAETGAGAGAETLSKLVFTPRVFSPSGRFANREVGISFSLGRAAPATVRVFSASGRLIREVASAQALNAGANLVRWDGRDRDGKTVIDGMYLVTVEAMGQVRKQTLAVVN